MTKWLPTIVTLIVTLIGVFTPQVEAFVSAHPAVAALLAGVYAIVKGLLPSPVTK